MDKIKVLVIYAQYPTFFGSYQFNWQNQLSKNKLYDCKTLNILSTNFQNKLKTFMDIKFRKNDIILVMHTVFSNINYMRKNPWVFDLLVKSNTPIVYFICNEYKSMPAKMEFCLNLNIDLLVSETNSQEVLSLYSKKLGCKVISLPVLGHDPSLFKPFLTKQAREIDIGYRATKGPYYLGHQERTDIAEKLIDISDKYNLKIDVSNDNSDRKTLKEWVHFLNICKGQIGVEAGTNYFELTDETRLKVNSYMDQNPDVSFQEIYSIFFKNYGHNIPNRHISPRHIEAAGTKTIQILIEGNYNGYFKPDIHYIPLKKDLSNFDEVIEKFNDETYTDQIVENAYELVNSELTFEKLLFNLHKELLQLIK